jgi:geranylgeranyl diphosphate synthase type II
LKPMHNLEKLQEIIKRRISEIDYFRKPAELYEPIKYTLNLGGKRLRPTLCLLACDLFGTEVHFALDTAIGIEIFHNFTLLHDDIMDQAPIRRGKATVHKKWNQNIAILSGDTMMALAYEFVMKAPEKVRSEVFTVFNKTAIEVCEGQQYDMNFETLENVSIADYIEMVRLKTAVLLAGSLKIGALIGEGPEMEAEKLYGFGENLGIAFQLKDDLLDVFSDEDKFGKMKGGDIIANKKTYLYLKAFELAKGKNLSDLRRFFSVEMKDQAEKIAGVLRIYEQLNIRQLTENEILNYYHNARNFLDKVNIDHERKLVLINIADQLNSRKF